MSAASEDAMFEAGIEAGADDIIKNDDGYEIICTIENLNNVRDCLTSKFGDPLEAKVMWKPKNVIDIDADSAKTLFKLIDMLEDDDDVQSVVANYRLPDNFELD